MAEDGTFSLTLVRDDLLMRAQRAIGLAPREGLGVGRRALALALVTWAPLAVWALVRGRALPGAVAEPLLEHFGIHVRCLVAIPLFVIAEAVGNSVTQRLLPHFVHSGLVTAKDRERFVETLRGVARLRDASMPWVAIVALVIAAATFAPSPASTHELVWDGDAAHQSFGFGAVWFAWVVRPVFTVLLLAWLWRACLVFLLCQRLARLDLALVPTHPDGAGGLGFLEGLPVAFAPVALGMSAVLASRWAHDVVYHGVHVASLRLPMAAFAVATVVVFLAPLLPWAGVLRRAKRQAELDYGALVARHGRDVRRRWILGEPAQDEPLLAAAELGPVADTSTLFEAVQRMRPAPIGRRALATILLPAALPLVSVLAIEVPVGELLKKVLTTLV
jgi:hypothetical protein